MIRIDRLRADRQGNPIEPDAQWLADARVETARAESEGRGHQVTDLYKHTLVKVALEELFYDKCAYCETKMTATSDWDVEHFRPKGGVAERHDHPGYYWLAYEWSNLYPSCKFCNQRRKDQARWGDLSAGPSAGKQDQFPLADETTRAMDHRQPVGREDRLLLDPCLDDPETSLTFNVRGRALDLDVKGQVSIDVFHLNRRRLRDLRRDAVGKVVALLGLVEKQRDAGNLAAADDFEQFLDNHYLQDHHAHAAVARSIVNDPAAFGVRSNP